MKKLIALALVTVGISLPTRAQLVVYDPVNNIQQILSANSTWFIKGQSHKRYYMLDLQKLELTQYKTEDDRRNN